MNLVGVWLVVIALFGPPTPTTFAVAGDSITTLEYQGQPRGGLSWINWATGSENVALEGGYALSGATTGDVLTNFAPTTANVLVLMLGTNDVNAGINPDISMMYLDKIVSTSTVPADRVIASLIAPSDRHPAETLAYNAVLSAHAEAVGWTVIDPWLDFRTDAGTWIPGTAYDELHPNEATQSVTGAMLANLIVRIAHPKNLTKVD